MTPPLSSRESSRDSVFSRDIAADEYDVSDSASKWNDYFDSALYALLDYEMGEDAIANAVRKAAIVADAALSAFEERWPK